MYGAIVHNRGNRLGEGRCRKGVVFKLEERRDRDRR